MARVTDTEVKAIITTTVADLTPFITAASTMVDQFAAVSGYSADLLKEIERWLAAHFVAINDPGIRSENIEDSAQVFQVGYLGKGLEFTPYGQQAKILDVNGHLSKAGNAKRVLFEVR